MNDVHSTTPSATASDTPASEMPELAGLDLIEDDDEPLPIDDSPEAEAEAGMSRTGPLTTDSEDVELVEDMSGVAS